MSEDIDFASLGWIPGLFRLSVHEETRSVRRDGFDETVDLSESPTGWHIFKATFAAAPRQADYADVYSDDYPGQISERDEAIRDLNEKLKVLEIRVRQRSLEPFDFQP